MEFKMDTHIDTAETVSDLDVDEEVKFQVLNPSAYEAWTVSGQVESVAVTDYERVVYTTSLEDGSVYALRVVRDGENAEWDSPSVTEIRTGSNYQLDIIGTKK